jgi:hypothetical protein
VSALAGELTSARVRDQNTLVGPLTLFGEKLISPQLNGLFLVRLQYMGS